MKDGILIGIDAGTSVMKSVAFAPDGTQLAVAAIPNTYETYADGGVEQDMALTWASAAATLRELGEKIPDLASRVIAISVTAQGDGMWLIDKAASRWGRPRSGWTTVPPRSSRTMSQHRTTMRTTSAPERDSPSCR